MQERTFPAGGPLDLRLTLSALRHGPHDPTIRFAPDGVWRATRTCAGPAAIHLHQRGETVWARAWGPGAARALESAPDLVGARDDIRGFQPLHPVVRDLHHGLRGLRMARTGSVLEALVPAVIEQKVTGLEAQRAYRRLVRAFGEPARGPAAQLGLMVPPGPDTLARLPYYAYHPLGLERRRADVIRRAAAVAPALERLTTLSSAEASRRLRSLDGIGEWTAAEVTRVAFGDPDAVSVGDYHVPRLVAWSLAGETGGGDARMLELLEPYRGQRARVVRLLELGGRFPPRSAPRMAPRSIEAI